MGRLSGCPLKNFCSLPGRSGFPEHPRNQSFHNGRIFSQKIDMKARAVNHQYQFMSPSEHQSSQNKPKQRTKCGARGTRWPRRRGRGGKTVRKSRLNDMLMIFIRENNQELSSSGFRPPCGAQGRTGCRCASGARPRPLLPPGCHTCSSSWAQRRSLTRSCCELTCTPELQKPYVHHQLMSSCYHFEVVIVIKLLCDVLAKSVASPPRVDSPAASVVGIRPQKIAHWSLMRNFLNSINSLDIVQGLNRRRQTSM